MDPALHISWTPSHVGPHGFVQFAIEVDVKYLRDLIDDSSVKRKDHDRVMVFTPSLNRDEVNEAVRSTRFARNKAFGADE